MQKRFDFLIIGSGIAGLTYALKVASCGSVCMITKSNEDESNTKYAQGGIAAVTYGNDSYEKHIQDTLICGAGLCNEEIVRMVIGESTEGINELVNWGVEFDKKETGEFDLAKEGGHSEARILHHKDITGFEIERALLEKIHQHPNIEILSHHFALEIITQHHLGEIVTRSRKDITCYGAYVLDEHTGNIDTYIAKIVLLATGGAGHVYASTTNPIIATGDGIAMVHRARGVIENMEFIQFHPTSLYHPGDKPSFLITEAMRGHGAVLRNSKGEEFMHRYDARGSLAPRDIVARAVDNELKISGADHVYLDCTRIPETDLKDSFPNIYDKCLSVGIDIIKTYIPVVPAAHYICGGVKVDEWGRSSIQNLYAAGECASTGLHGANRLASNSLLEAVVFANRAAKKSAEEIGRIGFLENIPGWNEEGTAAPEEMILITQTIKELQSIMSSYVGIVRSDIRLQRAMSRLKILHEETENLYKKTTVSTELCEVRNLISVAYLIIKMALQRKESVGLHYTIDYSANT